MTALREEDHLRPLPVVLKPVPDELLSSWLRRNAGYYGVTESGLIAWLSLGAPTLRALDHRLALGQVARLSRALRCDPTVIIDMTHTALPTEARPLVRQGRGWSSAVPVPIGIEGRALKMRS